MSEESKDNNDGPAKDRKSPVNEELIGNLLSAKQWIRIMLMVLYVFLGWAVRFLQYILVIVQTIIALFTGRENIRLARAGEIAALYQAQIWLFLSYASSEKPFPFSDLPEDESSLDVGSRTASGETYDVEPEPETEEDEGAEDITDFSATEASQAETDSMQAAESEQAEKNEDDDVFSDMSFSSAGKDFVNHEEDDEPDGDDETGEKKGS